MNTRFIDWIWNVRGSLALAPGLSGEEAFLRLAPLFHETGTTHVRTPDRLTFAKKDQGAQDRMSIFDRGVLQLEQGEGGAVLRYSLFSRALLFCFLAPLLFLAFGQLAVAVGKLEAASSVTASKPDDADKKDKVLPQHPLDKALGSPAPEAPKKDAANKDKEKDKKISPTAAYVFAGLFAVLYVVGRILEASLVRRLFRRRLQGEIAAG